MQEFFLNDKFAVANMEHTSKGSLTYTDMIFFTVS